MDRRAAAIAAALRGMRPLEALPGRTGPAARGGPEPTDELDYAHAQRLLSRYDLLLQAQRAIANALADRRLEDAESPAAPLAAALQAAYRMLLIHPVATKSAFSALVVEGRRYANSAEGGALRDKLARSPEVRKAALLWRSLSQGLLSVEEPGELPLAYLDQLLRVVERPDLVALLGQLANGRGAQP